MTKTILWIISIILMACISFNLYPEINKVPKKTFKHHPTPQPGKPQKVESWFPERQKQKNLMDEIEKSIMKKEVANASKI